MFKWIRRGDVKIPYVLKKVCGRTKHDDGYRWIQIGLPVPVNTDGGAVEEIAVVNLP